MTCPFKPTTGRVQKKLFYWHTAGKVISNRWRYEIEKLQTEGYTIIALDGPAHGGSGSATFNAILYSEFINVVSRNVQTHVFYGTFCWGDGSHHFSSKTNL